MPGTRFLPELVAEVVRLLDFDDRLTVSHVCPSWRRIAVSDRQLWTQYTIKGPNIYQKADALAALLSRSNPLPFRFTCEHPDLPKPITELIVANMHRMEALHLDLGRVRRPRIDAAVRRILALGAPLLKEFSLWGAVVPDPPLVISPNWSSPYAPLERLVLPGRCVWPAGCSFTSLRLFSGSIPAGPGLFGPLSRMFPSLTDLVLREVTQEALDRLVPLPGRLVSLFLRAEHGQPMGDGLDCTEILRSCADRQTGLQVLNIVQTRDTATVLAAFQMFAGVVGGPWALGLQITMVSLLAPPHHYAIKCSIPELLYSEPRIMDCWGRLRDITVMLADFLELWAAVVARAGDATVFPALEAATVDLGDANASYEFHVSQLMLRSPSISMHAPALRSVLLVMLPSYWNFPVGDITERIARAFDPPKLANISIRAGQPSDFRQEDLAVLAGVAECLEIQDDAGVPVRVYSWEHGGDSSIDAGKHGRH